MCRLMLSRARLSGLLYYEMIKEIFAVYHETYYLQHRPLPAMCGIPHLQVSNRIILAFSTYFFLKPDTQLMSPKLSPMK